jgi:hypothetical protein
MTSEGTFDAEDFYRQGVEAEGEGRINGAAHADEPSEREPVLPHDVDAEAAVLSAVMLEGARLAEVPGLRPEYFYAESHRRIFEAIRGLAGEGRGIDVVQVATWLREHDRLAQVGGMAYLTEVLNAAPAVHHVADYASTVHARWRARQLVFAGQRVAAQALDGRVDVGALIEGMRGELEQLEAAADAVTPLEGPTTDNPLRGLKQLGKVAVIGRERLRELAAAPTPYVWNQIAVAATIVLFAAGPGEGKTTLLFLVLAARLNRGAAVFVLGRRVEPAPAAMWLVLIEGEHAESSAARKLLRSTSLLGVDDAALERVILVARKAVRLGSPEWDDVVTLVAAGLVSDIAIDTIARVAPSDSDSEREQTAIFDQVAQAIDAAPSDETKPMVWACAHTKKNGRTGDVSDVAGSAQRTGQADSVLMLAGDKVEGRTVSTKVTFAKLREEPDEYPLPVTFAIAGDEVKVSTSRDADDRPLEARILEQLELGARTKTALASALGRNRNDIETALSSLFAARRITSTTLVVRGREHKAFALRIDTGRTDRTTPDEGFGGRTPDDTGRTHELP